MNAHNNVCSLDDTDHVQYCSMRAMLDIEEPKHQCEHYTECHQIVTHMPHATYWARPSAAAMHISM